jgi:hypothetical protein
MVLADKMDSLDEAILALRAAGWDSPQYEVLPDGSYHFFHNPQQSLLEEKPIDICGRYINEMIRSGLQK